MLLQMEHSIAGYHSLNSYVNAKNECSSLDRAFKKKLGLGAKPWCPSRKGTHKAPKGKAVHFGLLRPGMLFGIFRSGFSAASRRAATNP